MADQYNRNDRTELLPNVAADDLPDGSFIRAYSTTYGEVRVDLVDLLGQAASVAAPGTDNFNLNQTDNEIDSAATVSVITASGSATFPCLIGSTGLPAGTDYTPTGYSADSGYVAGAADVSGILSGYDHIVNSIASVIGGGGHNFIKYNTEGHSGVFSGSYNVIAAGRGLIAGGRRNAISGGADYVFDAVLSGEDNELVSSKFSYILNGLGNTISSAERSAILGGDSNTISSGANFSLVFGDTNSCSHLYAHVYGEDGVAPGRNTITLAKRALNEVGDAQVFTSVLAVRTTDATANTNLTGSGSAGLVLDATKRTAGTMRILLTAMRDGSADGNNDGVYTQVAYEGTIGFWWDGTDGFLFNAAGESTVTGSPTRDLTLISQTNNDFTVGAAPNVAINTGALRIRVTGIAATKINWVARIDAVMTIVS